jgi:hypothetical protein
LESADITNGWENDRPKIFGAILTKLSEVLCKLPEIALKERQRMADFERLGEAMMQSEGHQPGEFSKLYSRAVAEGTERAMENFGIAPALIAFMADGTAVKNGEWSGYIGVLFQMLQPYTVYDKSSLPKSPRGFSDQLMRLAPALRAQGIEVTLGGRGNGGRRVSIRTTNIAIVSKEASLEIPPPRPS